MKVSAIVPCYNAALTIEKAITSLLEQTFTIEEIIVINDGSTDLSLSVIKGLKAKHSQLVIIDQENKGVAYSRNQGIRLARGEYILTLDADDYFKPTFVEKALQKFEEDEHYGAVMCGVVRIVNGKAITAWTPHSMTFEKCLSSNGALSCLLLKKSVLIEIGGYDEQMVKGCEDWDLNIRILKHGYTFGVIKEMLFFYNYTPGSRTSIADSHLTEIKMQIYEKYQSDYQLHAKTIYKELITTNQILREDVQNLRDTRSFKLGNAVLLTLRKVSSFFKFLG